MTKKHLHSILNDLYAIDPQLKNHEQALIPLIELLLKEKPDAKPDKRFVAQLRKLLQERAAVLTNAPVSVSSFSSFHPFSLMKFAPALIGVTVGIVLTVPAVYFSLTGLPFRPADESAQQNIFAYNIAETQPRAFGDLTETDRAPADALLAEPEGRGGGVGGGGSFVSDSAIAPDTYYYVFEYEYVGEPLALADETVNVLKLAVPPVGAGSVAANALGLVDLNAFPGSTLGNFSIVQHRRNGYELFVNFREGSVSIQQNWDQSDDPMRLCRDPDCYEQYQLNRSNIPPDADIIALADAFLRQYGVDTTRYETGQIDTFWKRMLEEATDGEMAFSDTVQVIYPLRIEELPVYEQYGSRMGINVSVNLRLRRVTGAWNIMAQTYERSAYPAVTDPDVLFSSITQREHPLVYIPPDVRKQTVTVQLGTPTQGLIRFYHYADGTTQQLYVPALIFPVEHTENAPEYYQREVVPIPLARELLTTPDDVFFPMPFPEGAVQ